MAGKSKSLVVVESPAKAETIGRFLGSGYQVEASFGHVRDLPQNAKEIPDKVRGESWARLGVNVDGDFEPVYVVPADKKKHVKKLKDALKSADRLLLATDEDREGESISWHVLQLLKPKKDMPVERIVFHEVTPEAIELALSSPREVDENLVRAQEARRVLDRLYGYSLSPFLWKRVRPGLSAGRVQSVAVRLLVERERERIAFVSSEYWDLKAKLASQDAAFDARLARIDGKRLADGKSFDANTGRLVRDDHRHLQEDEATALAGSAAIAEPWKVTSLETKPGKQSPAPPFITSTLQQEGNRKLRYSSRRTMDIAQQLYEGIDLAGERVGLITYMRTDSVTLSDRALEQARQVIADAYGTEYLPASPIRYKTQAKRAQEAHEAIRPTDLARRPKDVARYLNADQLKLYELIWKRTLACQMVPARFERTQLEVSVTVPTTQGAEVLDFTASGKRIVFPGFLRAYVEGSDDPEAELGDQETILPALEKGQILTSGPVDAEGHTTQAPYRYTEASLVKKLEEEGIGRPSTYASIISTVQDRGYVSKKGNELIPTFTAFCVTELLEQQFADLVDPGFTAQMEDDLDEIADGTLRWDTLVRDFYLGAAGSSGPKGGLVERVETGEMTYPSIHIGDDPESGEPIVAKIGRYGPYVRRGEGGGDNAATIPEDLAPDELTLTKALALLAAKSGEQDPVAMDPRTGRPVFLQVGRFGPYLELEQTDEEKESKQKPKRVSVPADVSLEALTPDIAQRLITLPRTLGEDPESSAPITSAIGRYGPYVQRDKDFRSLKDWRHATEIELDEALRILAEPKKGRGRSRQKTVLKEIGEVAGAEGLVQVLDGRYGPYVTDGKTNASLPRGTTAESITPEKAKELLDARRSAPKKPRGRKKK